MSAPGCRHCGSPLTVSFADLGVTPLANSYLREEDLCRMEPFYPLHGYVCESCWLVQLIHTVSPEELFGTYAYFSSYSDTWLGHAERYADDMVSKMGLSGSSLVVEIGSNDGYLLQYFLRGGVPVLGIEPAANVAASARSRGIPTVSRFFGSESAAALVEEGKAADLIVANNVLAHVPDINDLVRGLKLLLRTGGVISVEFPHLLRLMEGNQFDTIYHEHFCYLSLIAVERVFRNQGLAVFDLEELPTHGGSLRVFAARAEDTARPISPRVQDFLGREIAAGLTRSETYSNFADRIRRTKRRLLGMLVAIKNEGKSIAGYGAPAKGNTLLNCCGIGTDFLDYTVDRSPHKQGRYLPGTRIPIHHPDRILATKPDYVLILPWNLRDEIMERMDSIRQWGGKFIIPIPEPEILQGPVIPESTAGGPIGGDR
ncbi:MAG: class I SAM-dependent methyltransferase [Desulfomonile tiedjei]|nr:class I SAM-dependent methyltransferase [Desulfomonile tiedjei]